MISTSKSQVNEDLLAFVKVAQDENNGPSRAIAVQRLSHLDADPLLKP